jgi:hypothetical protein
MPYCAPIEAQGELFDFWQEEGPNPPKIERIEQENCGAGKYPSTAMS